MSSAAGDLVIARLVRSLRDALLAANPASAAELRERLRAALGSAPGGETAREVAELEAVLLRSRADAAAGDLAGAEAVARAAAQRLWSGYKRPVEQWGGIGLLREVVGERPEAVIALPGDPATRGAVLPAGEVAILTGGGGRGKSSLALQWALAAAADDPDGDGAGYAALPGGYEVRRGPVVIAGYEDDPAVLRDRAVLLAGVDGPAALPDGLALGFMRGRPLYGPELDRTEVPGPLAVWGAFWSGVESALAAGRRAVGPESGGGMVVIDPATAAYTGEGVAVAPVRMFLDAVRSEAAALGAAVLVVAHPSKAGSRASGSGAESVAGSAAWFDAARGVLALDYERKGSKVNYGRCVLTCEKANYGLRALPVTLERDRGGPFVAASGRDDDASAPPIPDNDLGW